MGQLQQLSDSLERARSQYDAATAQLAQIQHDLRENRHELHVAKSNLRESQRTIAKRLVTLYTTEQASTLEVILGAKNLDDMINRMDSAKSVTALDTRILSQVKTFRTAVKRHGTLLAQARAAQARVVAERAAAKQSIESKIGEQDRLLASIKGQIAQMIAADAARQLQMAREAQARLAAEHRSTQQGLLDSIVGASAIAPAADTVVAPPPTHSNVANIAMSQLGTPYVWAAAAPGRVRLLGPRDVGLRAGRRFAAALVVRDVQHGRPGLARPARSPATSSSSTGSGTSASTSAAASSCTPRTPATW